MALFQESEPYKSTGMKEFFEIMMRDIYSEHFTRREFVIYGIIGPLVLFAAILLGGIIEAL